MPRRQHITLLVLIGAATFLVITFILAFRGNQGTESDYSSTFQDPLDLDEGVLHGVATAAKIGNETLKYVYYSVQR